MRRVAPLKKIEPTPEEEEFARLFELPSTKGGTFKLRDFFHRRNVVLYFFEGGGCEACTSRLELMAKDYEKFVELDTEVAAISADSLEALQEMADRLSLPFPLLSDADREVTRKYLGTPDVLPAVFIIDKYGAFHRQEVSDSEDKLVEEEEILSDVQHVVYQCPECGVYETQMDRPPE